MKCSGFLNSQTDSWYPQNPHQTLWTIYIPRHSMTLFSSEEQCPQISLFVCGCFVGILFKGYPNFLLAKKPQTYSFIPRRTHPFPIDWSGAQIVVKVSSCSLHQNKDPGWWCILSFGKKMQSLSHQLWLQCQSEMLSKFSLSGVGFFLVKNINPGMFSCWQQLKVPWFFTNTHKV